MSADGILYVTLFGRLVSRVRLDPVLPTPIGSFFVVPALG